MVHAWNEEGKSLWTCPIPEGAIGPFQVTIHMPTSCVVNLELADIDTLWAGHRAPEMGDLVLTEILPSTHPVLQCEFVEWTNVSDDTLDWKGCPGEPGTCLQASYTARTMSKRGWVLPGSRATKTCFGKSSPTFRSPTMKVK